MARGRWGRARGGGASCFAASSARNASRFLRSSRRVSSRSRWRCCASSASSSRTSSSYTASLSIFSSARIAGSPASCCCTCARGQRPSARARRAAGGRANLSPLRRGGDARRHEQRAELGHAGLAERAALGGLLALERKRVLLEELLALELVLQRLPRRRAAQQLASLGEPRARAELLGLLEELDEVDLDLAQPLALGLLALLEPNLAPPQERLLPLGERREHAVRWVVDDELERLPPLHGPRHAGGVEERVELSDVALARRRRRRLRVDRRRRCATRARRRGCRRCCSRCRCRLRRLGRLRRFHLLGHVPLRLARGRVEVVLLAGRRGVLLPRP